jgi:transcriptional regulator with XRE-family HTH domain
VGALSVSRPVLGDDATLGERLHALRLWRGMTLAEVGGLAGLSAAYLSMAERGLRTIDRRSTISDLAAALRVSETDLTGGPHLGSDPEQSGPHAAVPALRVALSVNLIGEPAADRARPLPEVTADLEDLRGPHGSGDYVVLGGRLPVLLNELYYHVSVPASEAGRFTAAAALTEACAWSAAMCHDLHYSDLAQVAARSALDAARVSEDPVRVGMAQFVHIGTAPRVWDYSLVMAERAASQLEPHARSQLGLQVLGMLTLRAALSAAVLQDGALAEHWLGEADAIAARVDDGDPARNWEWFGATNVTCWRVAIAVERAESGRAVLGLAERADPEKLVIATRRAALLLDVGRALAREPGTQSEAVSWLRRAEQTAPQLIRNYAPAREAVAFLLARARSNAGGRELRGMAARMGVAH